MTEEKTQKGNPHSLTVNQHCFPVKSIERFTKDGVVEVLRLGEGKIFQAKPNNKVFCAKRAWDQRAEQGFMKEIEDAYQNVIGELLSSDIPKLSEAHNEKITDMYLLWSIRYRRSKQPLGRIKIKGAIGLAREFTADDEEYLEKNDITVIMPDMTMSGRGRTGTSIQLDIMNIKKTMSDSSWGVIRSEEAEFLVPDSVPNEFFLPISPKIALLRNIESGYANDETVCELNSIVLSLADEFVFAQDLSKCPR